MIWNLYFVLEKDLHVGQSTCKCRPSCHILSTGDLLLVHNSFDEDEKEFSDEEIGAFKEELCKSEGNFN